MTTIIRWPSAPLYVGSAASAVKGRLFGRRASARDRPRKQGERIAGGLIRRRADVEPRLAPKYRAISIRFGTRRACAHTRASLDIDGELTLLSCNNVSFGRNASDGTP